jgi:hypothetical protein
MSGAQSPFASVRDSHPTSGAARAGCGIRLTNTPQRTAEILRANIIATATEDPECSVRLMVQGSQYWYSTEPGEKVADAVCYLADIDREGGVIAYDRRRSDQPTAALYAGVCVLEPYPGDPTNTLATWLFRHDVLDGWRCLRYLVALLFEEAPLTVDRLRKRYKEKTARQSCTSKALGRLKTIGAATVLTPPALARVFRLYRAPKLRVEREKFYLHAIVSVKELKALGKAQRLGSLSNTFSSAIAAAYFAAYPAAKQATLASNVLFDPDRPDGNHVCLKIATLKAPSTKLTTEQRTKKGLRSAAATMRAPSQQLADAWVAMASRAYVLGKTPQRFNSGLERRQRSLDILISNLPAYEVANPRVPDLQVVRDYDNWAPNIVYAIGVDDDIYVDWYWSVPAEFDRDVFIRTIKEIGMGARNVHTNLPRSY